MAVPCPRCGRGYDPTLFEFGRTIWCTCGSQVGIEARVRHFEAASGDRFLADAMLGRLARWLRLLGFDCTHDPDASDGEIVRRAVSEGRILLTRDRRLPREWWVPNIHVVRDEDVRGQLADVLRRFDLADSVRVLSRCNACNRALEPAARDRVAGRVPARILDLHETFRHCGECGRVYWEGSHAERIRAFVDELVGAA